MIPRSSKALDQKPCWWISYTIYFCFVLDFISILRNVSREHQQKKASSYIFIANSKFNLKFSTRSHPVMIDLSKHYVQPNYHANHYIDYNMPRRSPEYLCTKKPIDVFHKERLKKKKNLNNNSVKKGKGKVNIVLF